MSLLKNDEFSNDIEVLTGERDSARTEKLAAEEKPRSLSHTNAEYAVGLNKRKKELDAKEYDERQIQERVQKLEKGMTEWDAS
jgi:hypothetical protein